MPDYHFPEINTNGQFLDPKVNTYIETLAKNSLATALAAKRGVEPTELGTEHLDTVVVPDVYSQSSNLEATLESGYPITRAGILIVDRSSDKKMVWQTYMPYTLNSTTPQQQFRRTYYLGSWTPWTNAQTMAWESTALFTEDLNTLTEPRVYSQASNSRATTETNYPVPWAGILVVTANNSRYIVRQVYSPYANSKVSIGETWTRSMYNGTWSAWARSDAGALIPSGGTANQVLTAGTNGNLQWGPVISSSASTLTGPGRPDTPATTGGIITGNEPVGTEYRSTDGAGVGAWVWRKRPTGWAVTDGDTGWRDISNAIEWVGSNAVGTFQLRRVRETIHIRWVGVSVDKATSGFNTVTVCRWSIPGFEILDNTGGHPFNSAGVGIGYSMYGLGEPLNYIGFMRESGKVHVRAYNPPLDTRRSGYHQWPTFGPWPTTLPGSPA